MDVFNIQDPARDSNHIFRRTQGSTQADQARIISVEDRGHGMSVNPRQRSSRVYDGPDRLSHRSLLKGTGVAEEDMRKPLVAIANSFTEINPGHVHLNRIAEQVKLGVHAAGGVAREFDTIAVCDGIVMGHEGRKRSLPSREVIADSVEIMLESHGFDAVVCITTCDNIDPGMLMAAARVDIPAIFVLGGPMEPGCPARRR